MLQIGDFAEPILQHSRHFVAQADIERQVGTHFPVILNVEPEQVLTEFPGDDRLWQACFKGNRPPLEKPRYAAEAFPPASRILEGCEVVAHIFEAATEFDGVSCLGPERVVISLIGIPGVSIVRTGVGAAEHVFKSAANRQSGRCLSRHGPQALAVGKWIDGGWRKIVPYVVAVIAKTGGVQEPGTERVAFFDCKRIPCRVVIRERVQQRVGLRIVRIVIDVRSEEVVIHPEPVVDAPGVKVFGHNLQAGTDK